MRLTRILEHLTSLGIFVVLFAVFYFAWNPRAPEVPAPVYNTNTIYIYSPPEYVTNEVLVYRPPVYVTNILYANAPPKQTNINLPGYVDNWNTNWDRLMEHYHGGSATPVPRKIVPITYNEKENGAWKKVYIDAYEKPPVAVTNQSGEVWYYRP